VCNVQAVFDRQWLNCKDAMEIKHRDELAAMIGDPDSAKSDINFDEAVAKSQKMLQKILDNLPKPFILRMAEKLRHQPEFARTKLDHCRESDVPSKVVAADKTADSHEQLSGTVQKAATHNSTKILSVDDIWRPSTEWKRGTGKTSEKHAWSAVEEELVYKGVMAHGVGNWAIIRRNLMPHRTNVDIKDKWRTMKRQGRLQALADKLGPLPATCLY